MRALGILACLGALSGCTAVLGMDELPGPPAAADSSTGEETAAIDSAVPDTTVGTDTADETVVTEADIDASETSDADDTLADADVDPVEAGPACTKDEDCTALLPETTPLNCAEATCDTTSKKCVFRAKDSDGDGVRAKTCDAAGVTIETGDDCDDTNKDVYPGAKCAATGWDVAKGEVGICKLGKWSCAEATPKCDGAVGPGARDCASALDNDCNGAPDNTVDGTCMCTSGDKRCSGNTAQICVASVWSSGTYCTGKACVSGDCIGSCEPGTKRCNVAANGLETCSSTGTWSTAVACTNSACPTGGTACVGVCTPGTKRCNATTNAVETCSATGTWGSPAACSGATPYCPTGQTSCKACKTVGATDTSGCPRTCMNGTRTCSSSYTWGTCSGGSDTTSCTASATISGKSATCSGTLCGTCNAPTPAACTVSGCPGYSCGGGCTALKSPASYSYAPAWSNYFTQDQGEYTTVYTYDPPDPPRLGSNWRIYFRVDQPSAGAGSYDSSVGVVEVVCSSSGDSRIFTSSEVRAGIDYSLGCNEGDVVYVKKVKTECPAFQNCWRRVTISSVVWPSGQCL